MSEAEEETQNISESPANEGERRESGHHRERKSPRDSKRSQRSRSRAYAADGGVPASPKSRPKAMSNRAEESRNDLSGSADLVTSASTCKRASGDSKKYSRGTRATTPGAEAVASSSSSSSRANRDTKKASRGSRSTTPGAEAVSSSGALPRGKSSWRTSPHRASGDASRNERISSQSSSRDQDLKKSRRRRSSTSAPSRPGAHHSSATDDDVRNTSKRKEQDHKKSTRMRGSSAFVAHSDGLTSSQNRSQNRDLKENDKLRRTGWSPPSLPGAHHSSANDDDNDDVRSSKRKEQEHKKNIRNGALGSSALIAHNGEDVRVQRKQERNQQRQSVVSSSSSSHRRTTHLEKEEEEIQVVASPVEEHDDGATNHPETVPEMNENGLEFVGETVIEAGESKDPTDSRKRGLRWIVVFIVILVLIGGGVGAYLGLRSSGTNTTQLPEQDAVSTPSPTETIATKTSESPSNAPTDKETVFKYPVPSTEDCETIAAGGTLGGQDELEERNFEVTMDVELSVDGVNMDAQVQILEEQIRRILLPRLAGCPITLDEIQSRRLQDPSARNVIANGLVGVQLQEGKACLAERTEPCHVVVVLLNLRLLGFERYLTVWKIINDVFVDGNELKDTLELRDPFFAITVTALESVDQTPAPSLSPSMMPSTGPTVSPSQTPSLRPSRNPVSASPTATESSNPSSAPSISASSLPSTVPSLIPSSIPSAAPTSVQSSQPSDLPSEQPSSAPSTAPSESGCIKSNEALTTAVSDWFDGGLRASVEFEYGMLGDWCFAENVTSMYQLFSNRTDFNEDISAWDVSGITDMHKMFYLASAFNQNIGGWNVSQVTNMKEMLRGATVFNQPIGGWDVSQVYHMHGMFREASNFNQPIGDWDVSSVTSIGTMFYSATRFNQPIGDWDTSQVTTMYAAFRDARAFNQPIADWDTSKVALMHHMFLQASKFNQPIGDWDVSSVTQTFWMFRQALSFNQPIGDWDVSSVKNMKEMFWRARAFNQDISKWDVSSVTNILGILDYASAFDQDLCSWGSRLPSSANTENAFLRATSCPTSSNPDLSASIPGPFCYVC